jgi:hypothetical protein
MKHVLEEEIHAMGKSVKKRLVSIPAVPSHQFVLTKQVDHHWFIVPGISGCFRTIVAMAGY